MNDDALITDSDQDDAWLGAGPFDQQARRPVANPDDPPTIRPPEDARGPRPGPNFRGAPGRIAVVQGQIYIVGLILVGQLFLITTELYELLSGQTTLLWWITGAQLLGFVVILVVYLWPRRRVAGY